MRWRRRGRSEGWWKWEGGKKWEGFSKWLTAGEKGGQEGKNGLRRFTEGDGELGQCRWGCHRSDRSDQRAVCKKVEQFCFVPKRPSGSRPQLSPGTSTCSPHRVVGNPQPVVCEYSVPGEQGRPTSPGQRYRFLFHQESGVPALQNPRSMPLSSGALLASCSPSGGVLDSCRPKSRASTPVHAKMRWGAKGEGTRGRAGQLELARQVSVLSPTRSLWAWPISRPLRSNALENGAPDSRLCRAEIGHVHALVAHRCCFFEATKDSCGLPASAPQLQNILRRLSKQAARHR